MGDHTSKETHTNFWDWLTAAGVRVIKTSAQVALSVLSANVTGITDINWVDLASIVGLAAFFSVLTSLAGLPEVPGKGIPKLKG